jgi:nucleoside-diphosphate-sugar epimerase
METKKKVQTILGSGGGIGVPLAKELKNYTDQIRLVSRNPKKVNDTDQLFPADLNDFSQIDKAIEGSEIVYVTVGFEYKTKVWQKTWPAFMREVVAACNKYHAKLVFFDNVYAYPESAIPFMTEDSPIMPPSGKGKVRAQILEIISNGIKQKNLEALIARSADFYGPDNKNSALSMMVIDNLRKGKKAQAFGDISKIHTFTYTPDAAKATAILGNTPDAYNQVWHVPTTGEKLKTSDWVGLIAKGLNKEPKIQTVPTWMVRLMGLFVPIMKEFPEMMYQYENDYILDSTKFEKRFGIRATSPGEGIKQTLEAR